MRVSATQLGREHVGAQMIGRRQAALSAAIVGGAPAPIRFCALIHAAADGAYARALGDRIGDFAQVVLMPVAADTAPVALGPGVAAVLIWSSAAAHDHLAQAMAAYLVHDRASMVVAQDGVRLPAEFARADVLGPSEGDVVVDGGLVRDALMAIKTATTPDLSRVTASAATDRGAFLSGVAASVAVFGVASVGGYVFLPAIAVQDAAQVGPAPAFAGANLENAFAAAPPVAVVYAEAEDAAVDYVSARFGAELRVAFDGLVTPRGLASADRVLVARAEASALTPVDAIVTDVAATDAAVTVAAVGPADPVVLATLDQADVYGPMVLFNADLGGETPLFITDEQSDEPALR